ncbi:MAG: hypothetical protein ACHQ01_05635 [Candidatus Limnocylindrales bacterium]
MITVSGHQRWLGAALASASLLVVACAGTPQVPGSTVGPSSAGPSAAGPTAAAPTSTPTAAPTASPTWSVADARTCQATSSTLFDWSRNAPLAVELGEGISVDVMAARAQGAASAREYVAKAKALAAPGAEGQLGAVRAALSSAAAAFTQPITVDDFRAAYQSVQASLYALRAQCDAVSAWVDAHVKQ